MAISTPKLVAIGGVLIISVALSFALLYSSIIPQYSVAEFYNNQDRNSLLDKKVQIIGDVKPDTWNTSMGQFILKWNGTTETVGVHYDKTVQIPGGFQEGKMVMVEGILKQSSGSYYLDASMISTKCPSKYQTTS